MSKVANQPEWWRKPSWCLGLKADGTVESFGLGDAEQSLKAFKAEVAKGQKSAYAEIKWYRKSKAEKVRVLNEPPRVSVTRDISEFDGREVEPDETAAAVIAGEGPADEPKKRRGRPPKNS